MGVRRPRDRDDLSLRTDSLRKAPGKLAIELVKFEQTVEKARRQSAQPVQPAERGDDPPHMPTMIEIDEVVRDWLSRRMEREGLASFAVGRTMKHLEELKLHQAELQTGLGLIEGEPVLATTWIAGALVEQQKWAIQPDDPRWRYLCQMIIHGQTEVDARLRQDWEGIPRKAGDARFLPEQYRLDAERVEKRKKSVPVSLLGLLEDSLAEKKLSPATAKVWRRHVARFIAFVGHDDAAKITRSDIATTYRATRCSSPTTASPA